MEFSLAYNTSLTPPPFSKCFYQASKVRGYVPVYVCYVPVYVCYVPVYVCYVPVYVCYGYRFCLCFYNFSIGFWNLSRQCGIFCYSVYFVIV